MNSFYKAYLNLIYEAKFDDDKWKRYDVFKTLKFIITFNMY